MDGDASGQCASVDDNGGLAGALLNNPATPYTSVADCFEKLYVSLSTLPKLNK